MSECAKRRDSSSVGGPARPCACRHAEPVEAATMSPIASRPMVMVILSALAAEPEVDEGSGVGRDPPVSRSSPGRARRSCRCRSSCTAARRCPPPASSWRAASGRRTYSRARASQRREPREEAEVDAERVTVARPRLDAVDAIPRSWIRVESVSIASGWGRPVDEDELDPGEREDAHRGRPAAQPAPGRRTAPARRRGAGRAYSRAERGDRPATD